MTALGYGESATCGNCGKAILGPGGWGINPNAVCQCCVHDRRLMRSSASGCICPPGAEMTCRGIGCPRNPPMSQKFLNGTLVWTRDIDDLRVEDEARHRREV